MHVIGLNIYNYAFRYSQIGYASAMAVVLLGIILIVSLVQLKVGKQDWEYEMHVIMTTKSIFLDIKGTDGTWNGSSD